MGIGGSGISGVASLALAKGYQVTGCDLVDSGTYTRQLAEKGVTITIGHAKEHLVDQDLLVVSPAVYFTSKKNPEFLEATKNKKIMTWQKFLGKYLQDGMEVLCVAGTHGKSTTTGLLASILIDAGLNPSVMIGANVPDWGGNMRNGSSKYFITESDEFFDNFLNFTPNAIILNNIEYEHPDYFKNEKQMYESYVKHVNSLVGKKILIINQDSEGNKHLFKLMQLNNRNDLDIYGYTISGNKLFDVTNSWVVSKITKDNESTSFTFFNKRFNRSKRIKMKLLGNHNVSNAMGTVILAECLKIPGQIIKSSISKFTGVGRRVELLGNLNGALLFDDYAHHPTEIQATISVLRQRYPKNKLWIICEPHSYSRTKAVLSQYKTCFSGADRIIITPIFPARDTNTFSMTSDSIVAVAQGGKYNIQALESFDLIVKYLKEKVSRNDIVVVMGAGNSTKLAHDLLPKRNAS